MRTRFSTVASRYWRSRSIGLRHGCKYDAVYVTDETKLTAITKVQSNREKLTKLHNPLQGNKKKIIQNEVPTKTRQEGKKERKEREQKQK